MKNPFDEKRKNERIARLVKERDEFKQECLRLTELANSATTMQSVLESTVRIKEKKIDELELEKVLLKDQIIHLQNDLGYRKVLLDKSHKQINDLVEMVRNLNKVNPDFDLYDKAKELLIKFKKI